MWVLSFRHFRKEKACSSCSFSYLVGHAYIELDLHLSHWIISAGYGYGDPSQSGFAGAPQPAGYAPPPAAGFGPSPGAPAQPMFMPRIPAQGLNKRDDDDSQTGWNTEMGDMRSFSDKAIRHAFIRKVSSL